MSYAFDVDVLVYATDVESPYHQQARAYLEARQTDPDVCCVAWPTLMGYLRLVTHTGILRAPLTPEEALANLDAVLGLPRVLVVTERDGFPRAYSEVTRGQAIRGRLVPDAHLAAILYQHDVRLRNCRWGEPVWQSGTNPVRDRLWRSGAEARPVPRAGKK